MQSFLRDEEMSIESRNFIGSLRPLVLFRKDCAVSWHQLHLFVITRAEWKCQNLTHGEGSCKMFVIILTVYAWVSLYHSFSSILIQSSKGYRKKCCKISRQSFQCSHHLNISNRLLSRLPSPRGWSAERFAAGWLDYPPSCLLHRAF